MIVTHSMKSYTGIIEITVVCHRLCWRSNFYAVGPSYFIVRLISHDTRIAWSLIVAQAAYQFGVNRFNRRWLDMVGNELHCRLRRPYLRCAMRLLAIAMRNRNRSNANVLHNSNNSCWRQIFVVQPSDSSPKTRTGFVFTVVAAKDENAVLTRLRFQQHIRLPHTKRLYSNASHYEHVYYARRQKKEKKNINISDHRLTLRWKSADIQLLRTE
jgi:hypothetical protein